MEQTAIAPLTKAAHTVPAESVSVSRCVVCHGEIRSLRQALVAPFLATRIWGRKPFRVELVQCRTCEFMFYNPRLSSAEEGRLYRGYRSQEYQRMRQASEPWYTPEFNIDMASAESYETRRKTVGALLRKHLGDRKIRRVLDYGGDRGDLVHGLLDEAEAFTYDISGIPAVEGVTATQDPRGCQADLMINSNVLEHVSFPRRLTEEMLEAAPPGGLVFLEVPSESPFAPRRLFRRIAQMGLMSLTHPSLAPSVLHPSALYMMHEHINYYTAKTLATLMQVSGGSVIAGGSYPFDGRGGKANVVWCLGTRT